MSTELHLKPVEEVVIKSTVLCKETPVQYYTFHWLSHLITLTILRNSACQWAQQKELGTTKDRLAPLTVPASHFYEVTKAAALRSYVGGCKCSVRASASYVQSESQDVTCMIIILRSMFISDIGRFQQSDLI